MDREFHDLAERALNHESGGATCWGNLGLWRRADTYPDACAALADALADAVRLGPQSRLIETGFGCGDSLLHWRRRYGVADIAGLNLSHSQTALARQRLAEAGHADIAHAIRAADVHALPAFVAERRAAGLNDVDTLLALDCAYHFRTRDRFLQDAAAVLPEGGTLGLADILLARDDLGVMQSLPLRAFARVAHLPHANLQTEAAYRAGWTRAGFTITHFEDVTREVFLGFGAWLDRYRTALDPALSRRIRWAKYTGTARVLRWAVRHRVLRFVICAGQRRAPLP